VTCYCQRRLGFGQETPIIEHFGIRVTPLEHEYILPYESGSFDDILSVGVLEHVPNDRGSLAEIARVLLPRPVLQRESSARDASPAGLELLDIWFRQLLPKNSVRYPNFHVFEALDQLVTENTPLARFATNIEFVCVKRGG
jgi:SAM-dependent methyltransferase